MNHSISEKSYHIAFQALTSQLSIFAQRANAEHKSIASHIFPIAHDISTFIQKAEQLLLGQTIKNTPKQHLSTLFENIELENHKSLAHFYPIQAVNSDTIFPRKQKEGHYDKLWQDFLAGLNKIPKSHEKKPDLWLDHFDTAYQIFTGNIPSAYASDISLYDYSKAIATLATALYLYDQTNDKEENGEFLLIQGDFFGIQDFIFSSGSETNKQAAKLLRGRSFQVSLFTELAALKVLQACKLPSTSQIMNAAGKFLIIAPNTQAVKNAVENAKSELNQWFVKHTYGLIGLGIATKTANQSDFSAENFSTLRNSLFNDFEKIKLQRLDLLDSTQSVQSADYSQGVCQLNSYFPAEIDGFAKMSLDQILIGEHLVKKDRILICDEQSDIYEDRHTTPLHLSIFGYKIIFTQNEEISGKFGKVDILRFWDFELPENQDSEIWHGYSRRYINGYVASRNGEITPFDTLATTHRNAETGEGQIALMTLKGDVDNLGTIFQKGLKQPNLAKMAALSRQMNQFFSLWLPAICSEKFPNMYTVFSGGDDFFLIGPWLETQQLAGEMQREFKRYVADNPNIHFSAGMVMAKLGIPIPQLGGLAEDALEKAKGVEGKNAFTIYQQSVPWSKWTSLMALGEDIERLAEKYPISTAYLYALIQFADLAADTQHIESTMWRSRFYYKTSRYVVDKLPKDQRQKALEEISTSFGNIGIETHKSAFKIPLFNYFYQIRK